MPKTRTLAKPTLTANPGVAHAFIEGDTKDARVDAGKGRGAAQAETAPAGQKSGLVPEGDVRLTANIRADLHLKLKIKAAKERTTVGELVEQWIEGWD